MIILDDNICIYRSKNYLRVNSPTKWMQGYLVIDCITLNLYIYILKKFQFLLADFLCFPQNINYRFVVSVEGEGGGSC